jgi:hypothetical protein
MSFLMIFLVVGCSSIQKTIDVPRPVLDKMPESPSQVVPGENWVVSVETPEDCKDRHGILMSEGKAELLAEYRVAYPGLRKFCELDRELWSGKWWISQRLLVEADARIKEMQPGWWDLNKGTISFFGGMLVGAVTTIAVIYGVMKVEQEASR